jgi:hypothetical protein
MTTTVEYALLAGAAYFSNRADINRFPVPPGWSELVDQGRADAVTGYEVRVFQSGSEIVISYAGTDFSTVSGFAADSRANAALGQGSWSAQLLQGAETYLRIKNDPANAGKTITLSGHSLGGGLAALVAVFFDVPARTFDQAPFAASAGNLSTNHARLRAELVATLKPDGSRLYSDALLAPLTAYLQLLPGTTAIPRASMVNTVRVEGELLDGGFGGNSPIAGSTTLLTHGPGLGPVDLHSHALLTAFLQSDKTATVESGTTQSLAEASKKLTDLLKVIFDSKLFAFSTATLNTTKVNYLEHLVRHVPVPTRAC